MAVTIRQTKNGTPGTSPAPVTGITSATIVSGDLLAFWLLTTATGHISAISIQDDSVTSGTYATNANWNIASAAQANTNSDLVFAYRIATSTDTTNLTKAQWVFTGTSVTFADVEFDDIGTGFAGTPTLEAGGVYTATVGSASSNTIRALPSGTSTLTSGELCLFAMQWTSNITSSSFSWGTSGDPPLPIPTTTGGSPLATRFQAGYCLSDGSVTTNTVSSSWTTGRASGVVGAMFYNVGGASTQGLLAVM